MTNPISVDHYCTYTFGGAATAARRLHEGLMQSGVRSRFLHGDDPRSQVDNDSYEQLEFLPERHGGLARPILKHIRRAKRRKARKDYRDHIAERPAGFEVFSASELLYDTAVRRSVFRADIINFHWIAFFVDFSTFFNSIPLRKPLVWTLHDMNPFTGGCHYASGCEGYRRGCGDCPQLKQPEPDDASFRNFQLKQRSYRNRRLTIVTPSKWLGEAAQQGLVWPTHTRFEVIPYGLELDLFRPISKQQARRELDLPPDGILIGFGAEDVTNQRKGMPQLWQALDRLDPRRQASGLVFGSGDIERIPNGLVDVHSMGYVNNQRRQALIYAAADLFVMPSLEDNQPQTGLEAMACGRPVVAFDAGGIPDYVRPGDNGLLARTGDADDLAAQLNWLLANDDAREQMGRRARSMMETEFPLHLQASRYLRLYEEILDRRQRHAA